MTELRSILAVGATGSIGRHVVAEAIRRGHRTRALVRPGADTGRLDPQAEIVTGDLTDPSSLIAALEGIDAVIFTQGASGAPEAVDYGAVKNVLDALDGRPVRIALMTAIGVTVRSTGHDWKRRGERLIRASGNHYTIVRPGWFDYNDADQHRITMLQGDTRRQGSPADGVIARAQIARVLVDSLSSDSANGKTLELVAERGPAPADLDPLFAALDPDSGIDGVHDPANLPAAAEPDAVRADLARVATSAR